MLIIDFSASAKQSFAKGFLKGLGAPFLLFGTFEGGQTPAKVEAVVLPGRQSFDAIAGDWAKVGIDIRSSAEKYGKETANAE